MIDVIVVQDECIEWVVVQDECIERVVVYMDGCVRYLQELYTVRVESILYLTFQQNVNKILIHRKCEILPCLDRWDFLKAVVYLICTTRYVTYTTRYVTYTTQCVTYTTLFAMLKGPVKTLKQLWLNK